MSDDEICESSERVPLEQRVHWALVRGVDRRRMAVMSFMVYSFWIGSVYYT